MRVRAIPEWLPYLPDASDLIHRGDGQDGIWIILQRIMLSIQALRVLPSPPFEDVFYATQPVLSTSERLQYIVVAPMMYRKAQKHELHTYCPCRNV